MRFLIINSDTNLVIEEHDVKHCADKAALILNTHELNNDRMPIYLVQPTCPNCHSDEMLRTNPFRETWLCDGCGYNVNLKGKQ